MSRVDVLLDVANEDDLLIINKNNPIFSEGFWEADEDDYAILKVVLTHIGNTVLSDVDGIYINRYIKTETSSREDVNVLVYFEYLDIKTNTLTTSPKFNLVNSDFVALTPKLLYKIDEIGFEFTYNSTAPFDYDEVSGGIVAVSYQNGDFQLGESMSQSEKITLICNKGNLLNFPTFGAELMEDLNGVMDNDLIESKVRIELEKDELKLIGFQIDTSTGAIVIESEELNEI